jgi:hypothetical protein
VDRNHPARHVPFVVPHPLVVILDIGVGALVEPYVDEEVTWAIRSYEHREHKR